jgi:antitoxin VapB
MGQASRVDIGLSGLMPLDRHQVATFPDRHLKLFRIGVNQAVCIHREFELPGEDAIVRKEGDRLIIEAAPAKPLLGLLATMTPFDDDCPLPLDAPPDPVIF